MGQRPTAAREPEQRGVDEPGAHSGGLSGHVATHEHDDRVRGGAAVGCYKFGPEAGEASAPATHPCKRIVTPPQLAYYPPVILCVCLLV